MRRKSLVLFLTLFFGFLSTKADESCRKLSLKVESVDSSERGFSSPRFVTTCDVMVPSPSMKGEKVFVRFWIPETTEPVPATLFLHGRGYKREFGEEGTMIEHTGLLDWLHSSSYWKKPVAIIAPQDTFIQSDNKQAGNDYWLGSSGRDWLGFLGLELPRYTVTKFSNVRPLQWAAAGISMGALGAIKVGLEFPRQYPVVISHSPVFQATYRELLYASDFDTFVPKSNSKFTLSKRGHRRLNGIEKKTVSSEMLERNAGAELLRLARLKNKKHSFPLKNYWIDIERQDFGLEPDKLSVDRKMPSAHVIWAYLVSRQDQGNLAQVVNWPETPGHTMNFWRLRMESSFLWMQNRLYR